MARSNKTKKQDKSQPVSFQPKAMSGVIGSLFNATIFAPPQTLKDMAHDVLQSLNKLIKGEGKQSDWMKVLHRITVGSYSLDTYFKPDAGAQQAFNLAWKSMVIIQLRAQQKGELGVLVYELDTITRALATTDEMQRQMKVAQIEQIYDYVEMYYEELVRDNMKFYPPNWKEVAAMERKLAEEHAEVTLKEAA